MKTPKTSKLCYFAAIYPDKDGGYWSRFVDFRGADQGESIEDAVHQLTFFLQGIVDEMSKLKEPLPKPSGIEEFKSKLDPEDGEPACIVPVFAYPPAPTVRINITGKSNVFARIDDYARKHHMTRSDLMVQSTLEYIAENA